MTLFLSPSVTLMVTEVIFMWIKTQDGDYYNLDHCREIYLDYDGNTHFCFSNTAVIANGDVRDAVVTNIISNTKVVEVK